MLVLKCGSVSYKEAPRIFNLVEDAVWKFGDYVALRNRMHDTENRAFYSERLVRKEHDAMMDFLAEGTGMFGANRFIFDILLQRGNIDELKLFVTKYSGFIFEELTSWVLSSGDEMLIKKIFSRDVVWGEAEAERILNSRKKEHILLLAENHLSSVGIQKILYRQYCIPLTRDEIRSLEERVSSLKKRETVMAEIACEFDCIR